MVSSLTGYPVTPDAADPDGQTNPPDGSEPDGEVPTTCLDGSPIGTVTACTLDGLVYPCGNGCDDDGDGLVDLDDPQCAGDPCHASESMAGGGGGGAIVPCGDKVYQCGNGLDDDGDGLVDSEDPDCLGPCDNNESGFYPNIPGGGSGEGNCTFDCYFDDNSGSGGGDCLWNIACDPLEPGVHWNVGCAYDESTKTQGYSCSDLRDDQFASRFFCAENCEWRVPNGCDCFGCCLFPSSDNPNRHLFIGSKDALGNKNCTLADAKKDEPEFCYECTPVPSCFNGCGECELCLGKDTLPEHCNPTEPPEDGGVNPPERCPAGLQACGLPEDPACPAGHYCLTGCCVYFGGPG